MREKWNRRGAKKKFFVRVAKYNNALSFTNNLSWYTPLINPKTFQREMTRFFGAEAMSKFRYYIYLPGWDPLENLNQNWTSPKWGKTKTVKPSLVWIHLITIVTIWTPWLATTHLRFALLFCQKATTHLHFVLLFCSVVSSVSKLLSHNSLVLIPIWFFFFRFCSLVSIFYWLQAQFYCLQEDHYWNWSNNTIWWRKRQQYTLPEVLPWST